MKKNNFFFWEEINILEMETNNKPLSSNYFNIKKIINIVPR